MATAGKYYKGTYALCERCGGRPCVCPPPTATPPAPIAFVPAPISGNAIPFAVWDHIIPRFQLTIVESGVLLYLCRHTIGYGKYGGELISLSDIAVGLRISRSSAKRALIRLEELQLIERARRHEKGAKEYATTFIRVTLPGC